MLLGALLAILWSCTSEERCTRFSRAADCADAALRTEAGIDGKDPAAAPALFEKACDLGDGDSCLRLGVAAEMANDDLKAMAYYQRACGSGSGQGCGQMAQLHMDGVFDGFKAFALARVELVHACALGWGPSCLAAGRMVSEGRGVIPDLVNGKALFAAGCNDAHFAEACTAVEKTACREKDVREWTAACPVSKSHEAQPDAEDDGPDDAKNDPNLFAACQSLGDCRLMGWGRVPKDAKAASEAYRTACAGGSRIACNALGAIYEAGVVTGSPEYFEAAQYYKEACFKRHWPGSCTALGRIADEQLHDTERARRYYTVGCTAKFAPDCEALAKLPPAPPPEPVTSRRRSPGR